MGRSAVSVGGPHFGNKVLEAFCRLPMCLSVCLSVCLSIYLSIYLFVPQSVCTGGQDTAGDIGTSVKESFLEQPASR